MFGDLNWKKVSNQSIFKTKYSKTTKIFKNCSEYRFAENLTTVLSCCQTKIRFSESPPVFTKYFGVSFCKSFCAQKFIAPIITLQDIQLPDDCELGEKLS